MRNGGGSTDNNGLAGKKTGPARSHFDVQRPLPAARAGATSALRGADVVDAEFVHVDDDGRARRAAAPAIAFAPQSHRREQIEFENDHSAGFRRLGLFNGQSLTGGLGRTVPLFAIAALVAALGLGGIWLAGGGEIGAMATKPPISSGPLPPEAMPGGAVPADAMLSQRATIDPSPTGSTPAPPADQSAGQRTQGSMIYIRSPKRRPGGAVSAPVRGYKDLTISLAGGSGGR